MEKPKILLTGAGGFLGREILSQILQREFPDPIAVTSDCENLRGFVSQEFACFGRKDIESGKVFEMNPDFVINCSFARSNKGESLAQSLDFTKKLYEKSVDFRVSGLVNISTQSVYGVPYEPLWTENTPVVANSLYAMAKYATEVMSYCFADQNNCKTNFTNIRLASLSGPGFDVRLTSKFVKSAIEGRPLEIKGGSQLLSFMDVRDAAAGILRLLTIEPAEWFQTYNLGSPWQYSILEIAEIVKELAKDYTEKEVSINVKKEDDGFKSGIDSSRFYEQTDWDPEFGMEEMIRSLFEYYTNPNGKQGK